MRRGRSRTLKRLRLHRRRKSKHRRIRIKRLRRRRCRLKRRRSKKRRRRRGMVELGTMTMIIDFVKDIVGSMTVTNLTSAFIEYDLSYYLYIYFLSL